MTLPNTNLSRLPHLHRLIWATVLIGMGLLGGCRDSLEKELVIYQARMNGITVRNSVLSEEFLAIAAQIQAADSDSDKVAQAWQDSIIPLANELQSEVSDLQPEAPELREIHSQLVSCWTERANAYTTMLSSYRSGDSSGFKAAMDSNRGLKQLEESYFVEVNSLLFNYDLHLFQPP